MIAKQDENLRQLARTVNRANDKRRVYNLRNRAERKQWERIAYQSRTDYGEESALKPGYYQTDDMGWMD